MKIDKMKKTLRLKVIDNFNKDSFDGMDKIKTLFNKIGN